MDKTKFIIMRAMRTFVILAVCLALAVVTLNLKHLQSGDKKEVIVSTNGCCSIVINHTKKVIQYTSDEITDIAKFNDAEDLDYTVNAMQEFCYKNHFKN